MSAHNGDLPLCPAPRLMGRAAAFNFFLPRKTRTPSQVEGRSGAGTARQKEVTAEFRGSGMQVNAKK